MEKCAWMELEDGRNLKSSQWSKTLLGETVFKLYFERKREYILIKKNDMILILLVTFHTVLCHQNISKSLKPSKNIQILLYCPPKI